MSVRPGRSELQLRAIRARTNMNAQSLTNKPDVHVEGSSEKYEFHTRNKWQCHLFLSVNARRKKSQRSPTAQVKRRPKKYEFHARNKWQCHLFLLVTARRKKSQVQSKIHPARQRSSEKTNSMHNEKEDPRNTNSHARKRRALEVQRRMNEANASRLTPAQTTN
jgi:hypothetical protein